MIALALLAIIAVSVAVRCAGAVGPCTGSTWRSVVRSAPPGAPGLSGYASCAGWAMKENLRQFNELVAIETCEKCGQLHYEQNRIPSFRSASFGVGRGPSGQIPDVLLWACVACGHQIMTATKDAK